MAPTIKFRTLQRLRPSPGRLQIVDSESFWDGIIPLMLAMNSAVFIVLDPEHPAPRLRCASLASFPKRAKQLVSNSAVKERKRFKKGRSG
jgi:hypothetical protein